jgi:hexosaminidase
MYRRLALVSRRLEELGLRHESYLDPALRRLAGDGATARDLRALRVFVDLVEPVKRYNRGHHQPGATQFTPLTGLVDCARADSAPAREFAQAMDEFLADPKSDAALHEVQVTLKRWNTVAQDLLARLPNLSPQLGESKPVLQALVDAAAAGEKMAEALHAGSTLPPEKAQSYAAAVKRLAEPHAAVELPAAATLARLISHTP